MIGKPRIMVVDDNKGVLRMMRVMLGRSYEVHTFEDPEAALQFAKESPPHVAILDVVMPNKDGFWLFQRMRENKLEMPIIFNSAYQGFKEPEDIEHVIRPFAYLNKDGDLDTFLSVLERAVEVAVSQER